ncbi:NAD-binding protein [Flammeovirga yaeyamensis]|uniref:NAD-binding protein n=1 Tax=Flammeovirga yaeyamensis TaxID=367791 RepID=A0AAX1MYP4_9BACT|nr:MULTISPECIES: NAD-binding protein [Flammeovirga]ANQ48208.2 TrkA family potassium uptake protein [Flammeovirga sp. MY04]MBB3696124.1 trk system potassium uptake protein TrkA [Flammeovirga yaeyamensis]NMF34808.1 TrkA family potassium uptake protein [Flammeovirga yaeyamensis]QWG00364.1 NAD-binding protein [Flammeovirga yaeyamensis]
MKKVNKRFVLIGMGAFGVEIAKALRDNNEDLLIVLHNQFDSMKESRDSLITLKRLREMGFEYLYETDTTNPMALRKHIKETDAVILSHGQNFETKLLTIEALKEIGVHEIYARATRDMHARVLNKMGITKVIFPEKQEGKRFALELLNKKALTIDEVAPGVFISEMKLPKSFIGESVRKLRFRDTMHVSVICLKENSSTCHLEGEEKIYIQDFRDITLTDRHTLVIAGGKERIKHVVSMVEG